jgi:hypothetical protein
MAKETEVKAKLTLQDNATGGLHHVQEGFEHVNQAAVGAAHEILSFVRDAATVAVGFQLGGAIESVKELGHEIFDSASALEEEHKALAGVIGMADNTGKSFDQLSEEAVGVKEEIDRMAIAAGANAAEVVDSFSDMALRTQHTTAELEKLTEKMIYAGRTVPGGFAAISRGFQAMELGVVRANNPIVQLLRQTGQLQGNAKQVAKELTKMAAGGRLDQVMKLAESAMDKMAEKGKAISPTFTELKASLGTMREEFFETMGTPMLQALLPPLEELKAYLGEHAGEIEAFAKTAGEKVGEWAKEAAEDVKAAYQFLQANSKEIHDDLVQAFTFAKEVFSFIIAHKEEIAIALGASALAKVGGGIAGAVGGAASSIGGTMALGRAAAGAGAGMEGGAAIGGIGALAKGAASLVSPMFAAQLAITGLALAADQWSKLHGELVGEDEQNMAAIKKMFEDEGSDTATWTAANKEQFERLRQSALNMAAGLGHGAGDIQAAYETMQKSHEAIRGIMQGAEEAAKIAATAGEDSRALRPEQASDEIQDAAAKYGAAVETAAATHNQAATVAVAKLLMGSGDLQKAFLAAGSLTEEGFRSLIEQLEKLSPELAEKLKGAMGVTGEAAKGAAPKAPDIHFSGGQTFQIKQDFRDQDPDRVAVIFRRDVQRAATSRISATTGMPFGG